MKKLIIALALVTTVACVQAASVDWRFNETAQTSKSPLDLSGYTAYLFTADAWSTVLSSDTGSGISKTAFTGYAGSAAIETTSMGGGAGVKYDTGAQTATGTSGSYYIILADLTNGSGYVASSELSATAYESPTEQHTTALWQIGATATPVTTTSGTFAVPEPTSGLLLLLGVAGLALKRRCA